MMPQDKDQPGPRVRSIHINDLAIWLVLVIWLLKNFVTVLFAPIGQNSTIGPHLTDQNTRLLSGEHATFSSLKSRLLRAVYLVAVHYCGKALLGRPSETGWGLLQREMWDRPVRWKSERPLPTT
jgi:hypothetical protein